MELVREDEVRLRKQPFIDLPVSMIDDDALKLGAIGVFVYAYHVWCEIEELTPNEQDGCKRLGLTPVAFKSAMHRLTSLGYLEKE